MSEQEKQENQKTIVAFAAGLLIGGLLVWIFGGAPHTDEHEDAKGEETTKSEDVKTEIKTEGDTAEVKTEEKVEMAVGEGKVSVADQAAGKVVKIDNATFPSDEGWVGVRTLADGQTGTILGVARFSKEQGLIPAAVELVSSTVAGKEYAIVFFGEDGDRKFSAMKDVQKEGVVATFKAQ